MANQSQDLVPEQYSPLPKKPRLHSDHIYTSFIGIQTKHISSNLAFEVTSTTTTHADVADISGGDSGFQEITQENGKISPENFSQTRLSDHCSSTEGEIYSNSLFLSAPTKNLKKELEESEKDILDNDSDISDISCASYLSMDGSDRWKPGTSSMLDYVYQQMLFQQTTNPRDIFKGLFPNANLHMVSQLDDLSLWRLILSQPPPRKRLPDVNKLDDVVQLIRKSNRILVLTGAGVSVSCGIPDFRSRNGIYARLSKDFPDLPDPQSMFDIRYFRKDQRPFFKFAKEIYPGLFDPSISHHFIKFIERHGKLLRNYSQNIDTLEKAANIERVITCHGSFATASCTRCNHKVDSSVIKEDIFAQRIPKCPICPADTEEMAVIKPDIVFFGEGLPKEFHDAMNADKEVCDLLIVMGSSLNVRPVSYIPSSLPANVPQIIINREPLPHFESHFDVELLGNCDVIVQEICHRLGDEWKEICETHIELNEITELEEENSNIPSSSDNNNNDEENNKLKDVPKPDSTIYELCEPSERGDPIESEVPNVKERKSIAENIPEKSFLFVPPNRYIFKGAEVFDRDDFGDEDDVDEDQENEVEKALVEKNEDVNKSFNDDSDKSDVTSSSPNTKDPN